MDVVGVEQLLAVLAERDLDLGRLRSRAAAFINFIDRLDICRLSSATLFFAPSPGLTKSSAARWSRMPCTIASGSSRSSLASVSGSKFS